MWPGSQQYRNRFFFLNLKQNISVHFSFLVPPSVQTHNTDIHTHRHQVSIKQMPSLHLCPQFIYVKKN